MKKKHFLLGLVASLAAGWAAAAGGQEKCTVIHNGARLCVSKNAAKGHAGHGDAVIYDNCIEGSDDGGGDDGGGGR